MLRVAAPTALMAAPAPLKFGSSCRAWYDAQLPLKLTGGSQVTATESTVTCTPNATRAWPAGPWHARGCQDPLSHCSIAREGLRGEEPARSSGPAKPGPNERGAALQQLTHDFKRS